nr:alpha/beta hydrolase [Deinococcus humi]
MRQITLTLAFALSPCAAAGGSGGPVPVPPSLQRTNTTLNFGDFTSAAQWTYPAAQAEKLPAVLLIHGSTPADMDFTVTGSDGKVLSRIFADISQGLTRQGIAVLRYNKHYVSGPGQVDYQSFYTKADLNTFLKDAETALDAIKANPRVDPERIYVYGWSEGSTVAAALVNKHPEVAGLILQAPVTLPWAELFDKQLTDVQLPYLKQVVPGGLTNQNLTVAYTGPGGLVATSALTFALNQESLTAGKYELNLAAFDQNKNGVVELDSEYLPGARAVLKVLIETPQAPLNIYSRARALPVTTAQAPLIKVPVLILQGQNDANTPAKYLNALTDALKKNQVSATVKLYPGLGHSLGKAPSIIQDNFQPIEPQPINDAAVWIKGR